MRIVLLTIPPINVMASGLKKLPPVNNNGISPKIVVALVSIIGLNLKNTLFTHASLTSIPSLCLLDMYSTRSIPLLTVTPIKLTIPINEVAVIGVLNINKNRKLPAKLKGIVKYTIRGFIKLLNWINIMM